MGRRKQWRHSLEPANRLPGTRMRRGGSRQITVYGSAASCGAIFRQCERTRRPSSLALRRDPIRPRPVSRIGSSGPLTGSPENTPKRASIWSARLLCFNPAGTMIWPFASGKTPASRQCATWRLRHGRWETSGARYPSLTARTNGSRAWRISARAREHDLPLWRAYGAFFEGLARAERGALGEGLSDMRRCAESLRQQGLLNFDGLFKIALAEAEARAGNRDRAIATLDEALATADRLGYRAFEAELNRIRGDILLECDPAKPAPAEEAFHTAIAVARRQGTRGFELRAALSLAKLYQLTARPAEGHA